MRKIKVVIVDDSAVVRALLRNLLESDAQIEVVGEAGDGVEAIRLARVLHPHLLTMDLNMPIMNGMDAIIEIMATQPIPILVVSDMLDAQNSYNAIANGALDIASKPRPNSAEAAELIAKVKLLAKVHVIPHVRTRFSSQIKAQSANTTSDGADTVPPLIAQQRIFAIASSTGGPQVLSQILGQLPATFPCPIVIAQHIAYGFAPGMVKWLANLCNLSICLAEEGTEIAPATVYFAPSELNLTLSSSRRLCLRQASPNEIYHPSCDQLLSSVAEVYGKQSVGIILTGMGKDGALGIEQIYRVGGVTLAQDEASSVVFGMNKIAIDRGVVQQVLAADQIAQKMCRLAGIAGS